MIYLDWAATAPLCKASAEAMTAFMQPGVAALEAGNANANALYKAGRTSFKMLEQARKDVAQALGTRRPYEVIFTSGATESCNAALFGIVDALMLKAKQDGVHDVPEIVVSALEHEAVLQAARVLNRWGAQVHVVEPDSSGHITPEALEAVMSEHTILVSVMAVNNEIGSVMDIAQLAQVAHAHGALFHTDATQAFTKIPLAVAEVGVDALSVSAHKIGGPKGVGALYLKEGTPFSAQIVGGGQESSQRSGTQNVMGAVGFAAACRVAQEELVEESQRLTRLRDYCYQALLDADIAHPVINMAAPHVHSFGTPSRDAHSFAVSPADTQSLSLDAYAPHIVSVLVPGFESETLVLRLDNAGICVSGGSACSSHSLEPSHVLQALGIPRDKALSFLRISLGWDTTQRDIDEFLVALKQIVIR